MRVRVFKQKEGKFKVLVTIRGAKEYSVRLLPKATADELKVSLPKTIREVAEGPLWEGIKGLADDG